MQRVKKVSVIQYNRTIIVSFTRGKERNYVRSEEDTKAQTLQRIVRDWTNQGKMTVLPGVILIGWHARRTT